MKPEHLTILERARERDRTGDGPGALESYRSFLSLEPRDPGAWADYAGRLIQEGAPAEAIEACQRALALDRNHASALINLSFALLKEKRAEESERVALKAIAASPGRMEGRTALAMSRIQRGDLPGAQKVLENAVRLHGTSLEAHQALGQVYHGLGLWAELEREILRWSRLEPGSAYVRYEQSFLDLLSGRMPEGWDAYEARLEVPGLLRLPTFSQPRWDGGPFQGKTLLLHHEQGFGDTFMFLRYATLAKARGGRVAVRVPSAMAEVAATCAGVDEVVTTDHALPEFDFHIPFPSLPQVFRTTLDTIPDQVPYLDVPSTMDDAPIAACLARSEGKVRIGLVWGGSQAHKNDSARSLPVAALQVLGSIPGVAWHSLQLDRAERPPLPDVEDLGPYLRSFSETAYALSGMDLLISVDTAPAHLAGALGIPTFLLLPFGPDFRWMLEREDTPWYPSMRLYRQNSPGDWPSVLNRIVEDLGG